MSQSLARREPTAAAAVVAHDYLGVLQMSDGGRAMNDEYGGHGTIVVST